MTAFTSINFSDLPAPKVVEELSFESILEEWKIDFLERYPDAAEELDLESEPVVKLLETGAYREMVLRQRVNDGAKAVMLAYAVETNLDNLAALTPAQRKTIDPGDPDAVAPIDPTMEKDEDFRVRVQMAPEGFSTAGPDGAYIYHALTIPGCRDASVISPAPVEVVVTILGYDGDGTPDAALIAEVEAVLSDSMVRPFTDQVTVQGASILSYTIEATLELYDGPDQEVVLEAAQQAVDQYTQDRHRLGDAVTLSGIYAALHQSGVKNVDLISPSADIEALTSQAPYCTGIAVEKE